MEKDKLFNMLTYKYENDDDEIGMILSSNADYCNNNRCLISVKQFTSLTEDIKRWRTNKNIRMGL